MYIQGLVHMTQSDNSYNKTPVSFYAALIDAKQLTIHHTFHLDDWKATFKASVLTKCRQGWVDLCRHFKDVARLTVKHFFGLFVPIDEWCDLGVRWSSIVNPLLENWCFTDIMRVSCLFVYEDRN